MSGLLASPLLHMPIENRSESIAVCQIKEKAALLLRLHGIPVVQQEKVDLVVPQRSFLLIVFQHQVLQIMKKEQESVWLHRPLSQSDPGDYESLSGDETEQEIKLAKHLAVRSVYALGLDYGMVTIAVYSPTRQKVIDVSPILKECQIQQACEEFAERERFEHTFSNPVILGADPEFALRDVEGKMAMASRFFGRNGRVGCDAVRYREEISATLYPIAELRPAPADEPGELFRNLYLTMRLAKEKITDTSLAWIAGGMPFAGYPIGGHLHFSGVGLTFALLRKLDTYLTLPLFLLEDAGCRERRPRYGFFGDFREKEYGGFEYRTLPSWLISPGITKGVLALAKVIATHYRQLRYDFSQELRVQKAYYLGEKKVIVPVVQLICEEVARMPVYHRYRQDLEPFFSLVMSGKEWQADEDLRIAWKLIT